ncbi:hypothetical protein [Taibaiella koreensis]|uniref:hypothetical protein n=1 Tax=Taibaiella koreensis TaxID=1268548 RepID=UPI000E59E977|nr:hypothetical protein [Taibaiella koreensis]
MAKEIGKDKAGDEQENSLNKKSPDTQAKVDDPHRDITGTPSQHEDLASETAPNNEADEVSAQQQAANRKGHATDEEREQDKDPASEAKESGDADKQDEATEQQETRPEKPSDQEHSEDPHRGTAETPSQHKGLEPGGERNNDAEAYGKDAARPDVPDDKKNAEEDQNIGGKKDGLS